MSRSSETTRGTTQPSAGKHIKVDTGIVSLSKAQQSPEDPTRGARRSGFFVAGHGAGDAAAATAAAHRAGRAATESVPARDARRRLIAGPTPAVQFATGQQ